MKPTVLKDIDMNESSDQIVPRSKHQKLDPSDGQADVWRDIFESHAAGIRDVSVELEERWLVLLEKIARLLAWLDASPDTVTEFRKAGILKSSNSAAVAKLLTMTNHFRAGDAEATVRLVRAAKPETSGYFSYEEIAKFIAGDARRPIGAAYEIERLRYLDKAVSKKIRAACRRAE